MNGLNETEQKHMDYINNRYGDFDAYQRWKESHETMHNHMQDKD